MPYRLSSKKRLPKALRNTILAQIDDAIMALTDPSIGRPERIHQARKHLKKIRAVLRLIKPTLAKTAYEAERRFYRELGRELAAARDADVLRERFEELVQGSTRDLAMPAIDRLRSALADQQARAAGASEDAEGAVREVIAHLRDGRQRVSDWPLRGCDAKAVARRFQRIHHHGFEAMNEALAHQTSEHYHGWRKRVKDHWYHVRLLEAAWPKVMRKRRKTLKSLADVLGEEHDLAMLRQWLRSRRDPVSRAEAVDTFLEEIAERQALLRARAEPLGRDLFADAPKKLWHHVEQRFKP